MPTSSANDGPRIHFGTSGFRGRWGIEYTQEAVLATAQGICDYLVECGFGGEHVVVGYDSRRYADQAAGWVASVCLANGFRVHLAERDTPTPALAFQATVALAAYRVGGIINCTASHNPIEWHGIKFSPGTGEPAPPAATDAVTRYANHHLESHSSIPQVDLNNAADRLQRFDPMEAYCQWLLDAGKNDARIPIDVDAIADYFSGDGRIVIDEMHGAGRGYMPWLFDRMGVQYTLLHGTKDELLGGLHAANPEEPNIDLLKETVLAESASVGLGLDTDADRYGIVSAEGVYVWPNRILNLLTYSMGVDRGISGRLSMSFVTTHLVDDIAADIPGNELNQPLPGTLPPHMQEDAYQVYTGDPLVLAPKHSFYVPTGLKNLVLVPQMDREYRMLDPKPDQWMNGMLLGGEEAAGLTTRGHVPDKDGIWANLLVLDMIARYRMTPDELWNHVTAKYWKPEFERIYVPAAPGASNVLIDTYLNELAGKAADAGSFAGYPVRYLGGIPGKYAEFRLLDSSGADTNFLHIRPSGTEPLIRVYIETGSKQVLASIQEKIQADAAGIR